MIRLFVRHSVSDYTLWKKAYDDFETEREGLGVTGHYVFQSVEDPNEVTVLHDFPNLEIAQSFLASPSLKEAMDAAGVAGAPTVWFTRSKPTGKARAQRA